MQRVPVVRAVYYYSLLRRCNNTEVKYGRIVRYATLYEVQSVGILPTAIDAGLKYAIDADLNSEN